MFNLVKRLFTKKPKEVKTQSKETYPNTTRIVNIAYHPKGSSITLQEVPSEVAQLLILSSKGKVHFKVIKESGKAIRPSKDGNYYFKSKTGRRLVLTKRILSEIVKAELKGEVFRDK